MTRPLSDAYLGRLRSREWCRLRAVVLARQGARCQGCGRREDHPEATPLAVHHLTYQTLGRERREDLVALCRACHAAAHGRTTP